MKRLQDYLSEVKDFRRAEGRRFGFVPMLEMIVLAGMSGRFGVNPVARFMENNEDFFIQRYNLKNGIPSQTMLHNFMKVWIWRTNLGLRYGRVGYGKSVNGQGCLRWQAISQMYMTTLSKRIIYVWCVY